MKSLIAIAALGVLSFSYASSAAAFDFSPANTKFTAAGQTSLTKNGTTVSCTATFKGKTNKTGEGARITRATFSGASGSCAAIIATGLPWKFEPTGASRAKVEDVGISSPLGNCGHDTVPVALSGGVISFNTTINPGACQVSGSLTTSPTLTIIR